MAGPIEPADAAITTTALRRVIEYEPRDLTISVEAGLPWSELTRILAANRQMIPLDPPFRDRATVGGVVASNSSGPRRLLYGTARDLVIGMRFATLEGKLVQSGGMVVKNVAGLDMAKLMIGSFGTLAAIAVVNFKLQPAPETERSFLLPFDSLAGRLGRPQPDSRQRAAAGRHRSAEPGGRRWPSGNAPGCWPCAPAAARPPSIATITNWRTSPAAWRSRTPAPRASGRTWKASRRASSTGTDGAVVRASCTLKELEGVLASFEGPALARAGSGVCYGYFEHRRRPPQAGFPAPPGADGSRHRVCAGRAQADARVVAVSGRRFGNHAARQEPV
jgi:FAD/FMN-containing dehydrogenase